MTEQLSYPDFPKGAATFSISDKTTDLDLATAAANGDMAAFEDIYRRHQRRVYSICLRMLQNAQEAEDLTQDVFIQLYRKIGNFRGDSAFTTWIHRMTVNQVLMHFRKRLHINSLREIYYCVMIGSFFWILHGNQKTKE